MEMLYIFRTTLPDLPPATTYLQLPSPVLSAVANSMGAKRKPRVGIV